MKLKVTTLSEIPSEHRKFYTETASGYELNGAAVGAALAGQAKEIGTLRKTRDAALVRQAVTSAAGSIGGRPSAGALEDLLNRAALAKVDDVGNVTVDGRSPEVWLAGVRKTAPHLFEGSGTGFNPPSGTKVVTRAEMGKHLTEVASGKVVVDPNS